MGVENGEHAVRLSGRVLAGLDVQVLWRWCVDHGWSHCRGRSSKYPVLGRYANKKRGRWLRGHGKGETFNGGQVRVTASCMTTVHA